MDMISGLRYEAQRRKKQAEEEAAAAAKAAEADGPAPVKPTDDK